MGNPLRSQEPNSQKPQKKRCKKRREGGRERKEEKKEEEERKKRENQIHRRSFTESEVDGSGTHTPSASETPKAPRKKTGSLKPGLEVGPHTQPGAPVWALPVVSPA